MGLGVGFGVGVGLRPRAGRPNIDMGATPFKAHRLNIVVNRVPLLPYALIDHN